jgi:acetyl-CoA acetyltransferase
LNGISRRVAVVGIGETTYYRHGQSPVPEFLLAIEAIERAAADAGLDVRQIDGFCSYSAERSDPTRLGTALGLEVAFANMFWGGGGGGVCGAVANAAAALAAGYCRYAVVYRSLAQGQFGRFGQAHVPPTVSGRGAYIAPYGLFTPAQQIALRTRRFFHEHGATDEALCAVALAAYAHAQRNPRAVMYGRPLTREDYYAARWIAEPFRLYDCCLENDGAAAVVLTTVDRARDLRQKPAVLLASAQGSSPRFEMFGHADARFAAANFETVAPRLYAQAGVDAKDIDVAQIYENFTGAVVMSMVEHGFCAPDQVMEFFTPENLTWTAEGAKTDGGRSSGVAGRAREGRGLPINTSGGNLAECYMHGLELVLEAVRQVRGTSTCQVEDVELSLVAGGPSSSPVSSLIFCS